MLTKGANGAATFRTISAGVFMYAIKLRNGLYHLLQRGGQDTLCGLRINRGSSTYEGLQLAQELPATEKVCKHCTRINEQEYDA